MSTTGRLAIAAILLAATTTVGIPVFCTTLRAMSLERLVSDSDSVVIGRALIKKAVRLANGRIITKAKYQVERYVSGNGPNLLQLIFLGGTVDEISQYVQGEAELPTGERTLLFLEKHRGVEDSSYVVTGMSQGVFKISEDRSSRRLFALRDVGNLDLFDTPINDTMGLARDRTSTFLPLEELVAMIRKLAELDQ